MVDFDILITMVNDGISLARSLSSYLEDNTYTITYNHSDTHWAWIPIITQAEQRTLVDWFEMMQNEDVIILPIILNDSRCPTAFEARYNIKITDDREALQPYFERLKEHLLQGQQTLDKLNQIKARYQDFKQRLKNIPQNLNLIRYLKDLQQQIDLTHTALISPRGTQEANEHLIWVGI